MKRVILFLLIISLSGSVKPQSNEALHQILIQQDSVLYQRDQMRVYCYMYSTNAIPKLLQLIEDKQLDSVQLIVDFINENCGEDDVIKEMNQLIKIYKNEDDDQEYNENWLVDYINHWQLKGYIGCYTMYYMTKDMKFWPDVYSAYAKAIDTTIAQNSLPYLICQAYEDEDSLLFEIVTSDSFDNEAVKDAYFSHFQTFENIFYDTTSVYMRYDPLTTEPKILNGILGESEWPKKYNLYYSNNNITICLEDNYDYDYLYLYVEDKDTVHSGIDLYLDNGRDSLIILHTSSAHSMKVRENMIWGDEFWGTQTLWNSNLVEVYVKDDKRTIMSPNVFEYQISKSLITGDKLKLNCKLYRPEKWLVNDSLNSDNWIEIIIRQ